MRTKGLVLGCIAIVAMLASVSVATADDTADMKDMIKSLQSRIEKMEQEKAGTIHKEEMAKMMKEILDDAKMQPAMPKWMENLTFYGDFRLQYRHDHRNGRNGVWGDPNLNVRQPKDQNRMRFRLRFGFTKTWWDKQMEVGFRLASGDGALDPNGANPSSTTQTFTDSFSKKPIWIDLAYAKYQPKFAKGLTIIGGKMLNPIKSRTLVTWDPDINPEGIVVQYEAPFFGDFKPYAGVGFWMVGVDGAMVGSDGGSTTRDITLWTYELGAEYQINKDMKAFVGTTYYQYDHVDCANAASANYIDPNGVDNAWLNASGNNAADYSILEITAKFDWNMFNLPFQIWTTWVHNCGDDYSTKKNFGQFAFRGQPGADRHFQNDPNAYGIGLKVGKNEKKGDWSAGYTYLYEEYGSVVPGFSDTTFGGPNAKGHIVEGRYNIDDFLTIGAKLMVRDHIHTDDNTALFPNNTNHNADQFTTVMADLTWSF
ncbi:MAG: putative porin [Phycisphaerae bacterium]|nr:putative porin [Phycisphaerae bacterium]